jgi:hypothetical protein
MDPSGNNINIREVLGRLDNGIFVITNNYKNAIVKQNFGMISGNFASLKYYPKHKL